LAACEMVKKMTKEIPSQFVWALMNDNSGEPLENIIRRKNLERKSGTGEFQHIFWWGVGNDDGKAVSLNFDDHIPEVLFSQALEKTQDDTSSDNPFVWTTYRIFDPEIGDYGGTSCRVPKHIIVHSESDARYFAFVCRSRRSLEPTEANLLYRKEMRNLDKNGYPGKTLEKSQQPAGVVKYSQARRNSKGAYPVDLRANLAHPCFVKLDDPMRLSDSQNRLLKVIGSEGKTVDDYLYVVQKIRG